MAPFFYCMETVIGISRGPSGTLVQLHYDLDEGHQQNKNRHRKRDGNGNGDDCEISREADASLWLMRPNMCHKSPLCWRKVKSTTDTLTARYSFCDRPPLSKFRYWHLAKSQVGWQGLKVRHIGIQSYLDLYSLENIDSIHKSTEALEYMKFK